MNAGLTMLMKRGDVRGVIRHGVAVTNEKEPALLQVRPTPRDLGHGDLDEDRHDMIVIGRDGNGSSVPWQGERESPVLFHVPKWKLEHGLHAASPAVAASGRSPKSVSSVIAGTLPL